jgi:segregation and condensation protein B
MTIDTTLLQRIIEGALLAAAKPLSVTQLAELFEEQERPANDVIVAVLEDIQGDCQGRGFELKEVASGFRFQVVQEVAPWVARLWEEKPQKYSRALLETLALIAYRQPITRGDIEDIRGVAVSSHIIKTLLEREWIRVVGHKDVPGRPAMYATSRRFLDYFNLKSLDQLPSLAEIRDLDSMNEELALEGVDTPPVDSIDADLSDQQARQQAAVIDDLAVIDDHTGNDSDFEADTTDATEFDAIDPLAETDLDTALLDENHAPV